jgi:hypothetical protein
LDKVRERKLEARARRQESLHGVTAEKTIIQVPQPKNLMSKGEIIKVEKKLIKSPVIAEVVKRGRGRPPKAKSENIVKNSKALTGKKTVKGKGKK